MVAPTQGSSFQKPVGCTACRDCLSRCLQTTQCSRRPLPALRRSLGHSSTPRTRGAFESQTTSPSIMISPSAPPPPGLTSGRSGLHRPFAPAPLQGLLHCCGPFRPRASRYPALCSVCHLGSSLLRPGGRHHPFRLADGFEATGSPVPCQRLRRAHAGNTSTPDTTKATRRWLPGNCPRTSVGRAFISEEPDIPRFRCHRASFRCVSSGSHIFVFSSLTCPVKPSLFRNAHHPGS